MAEKAQIKVSSAPLVEEPIGSTIVSSKRRRPIKGNQNVSCLVDGCSAELSSCREYHRRHRVCECHSKTPVVVVRGKELRFCQQCSRFQSLQEFDEEKRSCRKCLDGHNRCRRKPQPQAFYMTSGSFFPNHHGTRLLQFSGSQPYTTPTASIVPTWSRDAKHHQELYCTDQQCAIPNSLACIYKGVDKRFPFFLVNDPERSNRVAPEVSISQRLGNDCGPAQRGRDHQKFFFCRLQVCSLSLLSILSTQALGTSVITPNQPVGTSLHFDGLVQCSCSQGMEEWSPVFGSSSQKHQHSLQ